MNTMKYLTLESSIKRVFSDIHKTVQVYFVLGNLLIKTNRIKREISID